MRPFNTLPLPNCNCFNLVGNTSRLQSGEFSFCCFKVRVVVGSIRNFNRQFTKQLVRTRMSESKEPAVFSSVNALQTLKEANLCTFEELKFDNRVLNELPVDPESDNHLRQVKGAIYSRVKPTPLENPVLVSISKPVLNLLGLKSSEAERSEHLAEILSGNKLLEGSDPAAHCYAGHQFGSFVGQLGDGAAIYLGEVVNPNGGRYEIQLKGAGLTPFSRQADGRKVLRSSLREFLCSEAMHGLGIPTTRALSLVTSDTKIVRDPLYSGNVIQEKASIVCRVSETFIRFGSFEIFKKTDPRTGRQGPSCDDETRKELFPKLLKFVMEKYYPECGENVQQFFSEVTERTAQLAAKWQSVGFCHGVLNTDNMSIVGVTIDYGPFGFLDVFDPDHICNGSDDSGRYSYSNQPQICKWNCKKLAEALEDVLPADQAAEVLDKYDEWYHSYFLEIMRGKLGLMKAFDGEGDEELMNEFFAVMEASSSDFTNSFLAITNSSSKEEALKNLLQVCGSLEAAIAKVRPRLDPRTMMQLLHIKDHNPAYLKSFGGDKMLEDEVERSKKRMVLSKMTEEEKQNGDIEIWSKWLDKYYARLSEENAQLSHLNEGEIMQERRRLMSSRNPKIVLRNWMAQRAIEKAEAGDYSEVNKLLTLLENPFSDEIAVSSDGEEYVKLPPAWARELCVTCSS
jgi:uncharacterized protein YdiU (UPF0061 family)